MGGTLEFDRTVALDQATRLFWKSGYAGTSLRDLLAGMGIGEGSFYNTLKSKKHAYLACLQHYNATVGRRRAEAFASAPTAALAVRALFATVLDCLDDPNTPSPVCLMAGTMTEEVLADLDLRGYVEEQMTALAAGMTARLEADKQQGLLPGNLDPATLVPILVTYMQGLWRMALVAYDRPAMERQVSVFLSALGL